MPDGGCLFGSVLDRYPQGSETGSLPAEEPLDEGFTDLQGRFGGDSTVYLYT